MIGQEKFGVKNMIDFRCFLIIILLVFSSANGGDLFMYMNDDVNKVYIETISFSNNTTYYGHSGLIYKKCKKGYNCINYHEIKLSIPDSCMFSNSYKWDLYDFSYEVVSSKKIYLQDFSYLIYKVNFSGNGTKGSILYSYENGIISFSILNKIKDINVSFSSLKQDGIFKNSKCIPLAKHPNIYDFNFEK